MEGDSGPAPTMWVPVQRETSRGHALESGGEALQTATARALHDMQRLLADAIHRLRATQGCHGAVAWGLRADRSPTLVAADFEGEPPLAPSPEAFAAIAALPAATDLRSPGCDAALRTLETPLRWDAVAPVRAHGRDDTLAALLVTGDVDRRLLEALDGAAKALASPLAAALAVGRLAQLDAEVRRLDRLATLGALAAEVAHEIRNPLVTLQTFVQLLPERREDPEFLERYLAVVSGELRRMNRLLDLLVEQAQPPGPVVAADHARVGPALEALGELLRQRALVRGVVLHLESAPDLPPVLLGEDALHQVLLNLAQNALDATPEGGRVEVTARDVGRSVELCVIDEGPGIDSSQRQRVFEPFFSTRSDRPGGIGLAITRRLVEEAGGRIEVQGNPSGGSCFRVNLPEVGAGDASRGD